MKELHEDVSRLHILLGGLLGNGTLGLLGGLLGPGVRRCLGVGVGLLVGLLVGHLGSRCHLGSSEVHGMPFLYRLYGFNFFSEI